MALLMKQDENRSELQQKIAADIAERQRAAAGGDGGKGEPNDGVTDSRFIEGTGQASRVGVAVIVLFILFAIATVIVVSLPR